MVAARLSEDPSTRVLVLEGGPPDDLPEIAMPAATPTLWLTRRRSGILFGFPDGAAAVTGAVRAQL